MTLPPQSRVGLDPFRCLRSAVPRSAAFAAALLLWASAIACQPSEAVVEQSPEERAIQVATARAKPGEIADTARLVGTVHPLRQVRIAAETSGTIEQIFVELGEEVTKGQLLAKMDQARSEAQRTQAEAQLLQAESTAQLSRLDLDRIQRLHQKGASSTIELQRAEAQWTGASASKKAAEAALRLAETQIKAGRFVAPFSGRIATRHLELGALVAPGSPAFDLVDSSSVRVKAGADAATLRELQIGQEVRLGIQDQIPNERGPRLIGTISHIGPLADSQTRTFPIEVQAKNDGTRLLPGSLVSLQVVLQTREGAVLIPDLAVALGPPASVFVLEGDTAHRRSIELGAVDGEDREVLSGLKAGDEVVTLGRQHLSEGARVKRYSMTAQEGVRGPSDPNQSPGEG